jgi:hypothetical protein
MQPVYAPKKRWLADLILENSLFKKTDKNRNTRLLRLGQSGAIVGTSQNAANCIAESKRQKM